MTDYSDTRVLPLNNSHTYLFFRVIRTMFMPLWIAFTIIVELLPALNSVQVLGIFPIHSISHHSINQPIVKGLAARGHNVTILSPFKSSISLPNYTEILLGDMMPFVDAYPLDQAYKFASTWNNIFILTEMEKIGCTQVYQSDYIRQLMKSDQKVVDLIIAEAHHTRCFHIIAEKLNVPLIRILPPSMGVTTDLDNGGPNNPAYVPVITSLYSTKMGFVERTWNTIEYAMIYIGRFTVFDHYLPQIIHEHVNLEIPVMDILNRREALTLYNNHFSFINKPIASNAVNVAGVHILEAKPLPRDIQQFIDDAEHGVIFFSLGSLLKSNSVSPDKMQMIRRVFSQIPQRVLWRFDQVKKSDLPENVKTAQWFPQRDVLEHKNVRAFISHCGLMSTLEAIHTQTPVIAMPFLFDQFQNSRILLEKEVAVLLDYRTLSKDGLLSAVNNIMNNTKYQANMHKLSELFKDRPMSPLDTALYWCEYVIKHGGAHLRLNSANMPLYQYLLLDVVAFILIVTGSVFWLCKFLVRTMFRYSFI